MVLAFVTVSAVLGSSAVRGLAALFFGIWLGLIGVDLQTGQARFTFGLPELLDGINVIVVAVGLFAVGETLYVASRYRLGKDEIIPLSGSLWMTAAEWKRSWKPWLRGTAIGFPIGAMPAGGAEIPTFLSYYIEQKLTSHPQEFGKGAIEGVAGPEAAVNADTCGAFVHLLALGIPASGSTAVIMGAFITYGIQPGPMLFATHPDLVWGLIASMYVGNLMLLVLNLPLVGLFARVLYVPPGILLVIILGVASAGVYSFETNTFDLYLALMFGVLGYVFRKLDIPKAPLIFGLILGDKIEQSFRQAMTISSGDPIVFLRSPLAVGLLALAAVTVLFSFWAKRKSAATLAQAAGAGAPGAQAPAEGPALDQA
jgi:putative tricarboxylic transport membrane protein